MTQPIEGNVTAIDRKKDKHKIKRIGCFSALRTNSSDPAGAMRALRAKYVDSQAQITSMEKERIDDKKMLLELSGVVRTLQNIAVDYEQVKTRALVRKQPQGKSLDNVKRKIAAIDENLIRLKHENEHLKMQKSAQDTTISSQENQIRYLEKQVGLLETRLTRSLNSNRSKEEKLTEECNSLRQKNASKDIRICSLEAMLESMVEGRDCETRQMKLVKTCKELEEANCAQDEHIAYLETQLRAYKKAAKLPQTQNIVPVANKGTYAESYALSLPQNDPSTEECKDIVPTDVRQDNIYAENFQAGIRSASPQPTASTDGVLINVEGDSTPEFSDVSMTSDTASMFSSDSTEPVTTASSKTHSLFTVSSLNTDSFVKRDDVNRRIAAEYSRLNEKYKRLKVEHAGALAEIIELHAQKEGSENITEEKKALLAKIEYLEVENSNYEKFKKEFDVMSKKVLELEQKGDVYEDLKRTNDADKDNYENLKDEYDGIVAKLLELEDLKQLHNALQEEHEEERASHDTLKKEYDAVSTRLSELEKQGSKDENFKQFQDQYEKLKEKHEKSEQTILQLEIENSKFENLQRDHDIMVEKVTQHNAMFQREYTATSQKVAQLEEENSNYKSLQQDHNNLERKVTELEQVSAEYDRFKQEQENKAEIAIELEKDKFSVVNKKLQLEYNALGDKVKELEKEKVDLKQEVVKFKDGKLQNDYDTLVAKVTDLEKKSVEYNLLKEEHNCTANEVSELKKAIENYENLQRDHDAMAVKLKETNVGFETLYKDFGIASRKAKELDKQMVKNENLQRDRDMLNAELVKVQDELRKCKTVNDDLEKSLKMELENVKQKYYAAVVRVETLEQKLSEAIEKAKVTMEEKKKHELYLVDVIYHYKTLRAEHEAAEENITKLQAVIDASNCPSDEETSQNSTPAEELIDENDTDSDSINDDQNEAQDEDPDQEHVESSENVDPECSSEKSEESIRLDEAIDSIEQQTQELLEQQQHHQEEKEQQVLQEQQPFDECSNAETEQVNNPQLADEMERKRKTNLLKQRDVAIGQMDMIDQELQEMKKELEESKQHQVARENHLEFVREQYENLQSKYDKLLITLKHLKGASMSLSGSEISCNAANSTLDGVDNNKQNNESSSSSSKVDENSDLQQKLDTANQRHLTLLDEHEAALTKLEIMGRKLRSAEREASIGTRTKQNRDDYFRDIVARYKKLEREHGMTKLEIGGLSIQLQHAKAEVRRREEDAKSTRKRLAGCHYQFKKLQHQYDVAIETFNDVENNKDGRKQKKITTSVPKSVSIDDNDSPDNNVLAEKVRLVIKENKEIKAYCDELLTMMETKTPED